MADGLMRAILAKKKESKNVRPRARQRGHTKEFEVSLRVLSNPEATLENIKDYLMDLEWAGGCRHPDDALFSSITIVSKRVSKPARGHYGRA